MMNIIVCDKLVVSTTTKNAKNSDLNQKTLPPDPNTKTQSCTSYGKSSTSPSLNAEPTHDPCPTTITKKSSTTVVDRARSDGLCHLIQYYVGGQGNSDSATEHTLPSPTDFGRSSSRNEQLHESCLGEQCSTTNCSKHDGQPYPRYEGGMEPTTSRISIQWWNFPSSPQK